jgi:hypothetical protein
MVLRDEIFQSLNHLLFTNSYDLALIEADSLLCRGLAQQLEAQSRTKLPNNHHHY